MPTITLTPFTLHLNVNQTIGGADYNFQGTGAVPITASAAKPAWLSVTVTRINDIGFSGTAPATPSATVFYLSGLGYGNATYAALTYSQKVTVIVAALDAGSPPAVSSSDASGQVGQAFEFQVSATNTPTSYAATGLPDGLVIDAATGAISGTPTTAGDYTVTLSATNAAGTGSIVASFSIEGGDSSGRSPNAFVQIDLPTGAVTAQAGALAANHGDQIIFAVQFIPDDFVANITAVKLLLKEKSEVQQFQALLSATANTTDKPSTFQFEVLTLGGALIDAAMALFDGVLPSTAVTFSLQFLYTWDGRVRTSAVMDFVLTRDLELVTVA